MRRDAQSGTLGRYYFVTDRVGSIVGVLDGAGAWVERVRYDVWGRPSIEPADAQPPAVSRIEVTSSGDVLVVFTSPWCRRWWPGRAPRVGTTVATLVRQFQAQFELYRDEPRAAMERPHVKDPHLAIVMGELYCDEAMIGSGSTAAALRAEMITGLPAKGRFHFKMTQLYIQLLKKWIARSPTAAPGDRAAAENVLRDMLNAVDGR